MDRLVRIQATGVKGFVDLDLHLDDLTVLYGPCGSGKSTVARVLHVLKDTQNCQEVVEYLRAGYHNMSVTLHLESNQDGPLVYEIRWATAPDYRSLKLVSETITGPYGLTVHRTGLNLTLVRAATAYPATLKDPGVSILAGSFPDHPDVLRVREFLDTVRFFGSGDIAFLLDDIARSSSDTALGELDRYALLGMPPGASAFQPGDDDEFVVIMGPTGQEIPYRDLSHGQKDWVLAAATKICLEDPWIKTPCSILVWDNVDRDLDDHLTARVMCLLGNLNTDARVLVTSRNPRVLGYVEPLQVRLMDDFRLYYVDTSSLAASGRSLEDMVRDGWGSRIRVE